HIDTLWGFFEQTRERKRARERGEKRKKIREEKGEAASGATISGVATGQNERETGESRGR
ncbi:hypothetical protein U1Q18_022667, partial [Sarracenia purpurea var. burkii]